MKNGRISKGKLIRPTFFVFCEGETEDAYIKYLRSIYRIPIQIDSKISGSAINDKYIDKYKSTKSIHPKDKTFLIYDADIQDIVDKLKKIDNVVLLLSNPCFELWYLLHFINQNSDISSSECIQKLSRNLRVYKKGVICDKLKRKLEEEQSRAISRAKVFEKLKNPSTEVFHLVEDLEKIKTEK